MPIVTLTADWNDYPAGCELEVSDEVAAKIVAAGACEGRKKPAKKKAPVKVDADEVVLEDETESVKVDADEGN